MDILFQFASFEEFYWMEGHGPYVWAAYALTLGGLIGLSLKGYFDRKNFYRLAASQIKRRQQEKAEQA